MAPDWVATPGTEDEIEAVMEYAAAEILELSGQELGKRKRITPQDLMKGIRNDEELNQLMGGCAVFTSDRIKNVSQAVTFKPKNTPEDE